MGASLTTDRSRAPRTARIASLWLPGAVCLLSLGLSVWSWYVVDQHQQREASGRFDRQRDRVVTAIEHRMRIYQQILQGAQGLFAASDSVDRHEFHTYVKNLNIEDYYPGIQGIGYSELIQPSQLAEHIQRVRGEGFTSYAVRPKLERAEYTAIVYLEPFDWRNRRALGYDMYSEPVRRAAMARARDTGLPSVSGKVTLVQETDQDVQAGFVMYLPVYRDGAALTSVVQRRHALVGYVYSPFRMNDLMRGMFRQDAPLVHVKIYSGDTQAVDNLMYESGTGKLSGSGPLPDAIERTAKAHPDGHIWTVVMTSTPAFHASVHGQTPRTVLIAGCVLSLLFCSITWSIATSRDRAHALADKMTVDLRLAKESVEDTNLELVAINNDLRREQVERERAQRLLQEHARQLEISNRELQDFAYVASHDLQEPLRKIQAFGDLVASTESGSLSEIGRDYLRRTRAAAGRMRTLIDDLLALSRVTSQARPFVRIDLNRVAREVVDDLEARLQQSGGSVEVDDLPTVNADPTQMRQLLQNLIGNALKFQSPGTPPRIRVYARQAAANDEGRRQEHRAWQVFVEDNGIGFDVKYLERIFAPFQRLHGRSHFEGTGMGLAICQKIVNRHGGEITARSQRGEGSTFIFTLPGGQAGVREKLVGGFVTQPERITA